MEKTINVEVNSPFWIGEKVYVVERDDYSLTEFKAKCPACNDTRKMKTVGANGVEYEVDCPLCAPNKRSSSSGYSNTLNLRKWVVTEFAINRVELRGPEAKVKYGNGKEIELTPVSMGAVSMNRSISLPVSGYYEDKVDVPVDKLKGYKDENNRKTLFYHKRSDAVKALDYIKKCDRERLEEFNKTYGCSHEYPW